MPYYPQNPYEPIMSGMESLSGAIKDVRDRDIARMEQKRKTEQDRMDAQLQSAQTMKGLALEEAGLERGAMQDRFAAMNAYREDINRQKQLDLNKLQAGVQERETVSDIARNQEFISASQQARAKTPIGERFVPIFGSDKLDELTGVRAKIVYQKLQPYFGMPVTDAEFADILGDKIGQSSAAMSADYINEYKTLVDSAVNSTNYEEFQKANNFIKRDSMGLVEIKPVEITMKIGYINESKELVSYTREQLAGMKDALTQRVLSEEEHKNYGQVKPGLLKLPGEEAGTTVKYLGYDVFLDGEEVYRVGAEEKEEVPPGVVPSIPQIPSTELRTVQQIRKDYARLHPITTMGGGGMGVVPMVTTGQQYGTAKTLGEMEKEVQTYKETKANKMVSDAITRLENNVENAKGVRNFVLEVSAFDATNDVTMDWITDKIRKGIIPLNWVIKTPGGTITPQQLLDAAQE